MKYHVIHIETSFPEEWQKDLFEQQLFDLGVDTIDGDMYYIPSEALEAQRSAIRSLISGTEGASLLSVEACPDENWNAAWEAEHPMQELPLGVRIVPHCAFGAGHHETTSMMIDALIHANAQLSHFQLVLDHGTGTGVLAIFAKRLGAGYVLAIDIDEKSVENAKENAALNGVEIEVRAGSTPPEGETFDLMMANIHRNILLDNMTAYARGLTPGGELWLSGFYEEDCPALIAAARAQGLRLIGTHAQGDWRMLRFNK